MTSGVKTVGPGFIAITVSNVARSAEFYECYLGAVRDPFDFGPNAAAFLGWPAFSVTARRPGMPAPDPETTGIVLWWRAARAQELYESLKNAGVRILHEPFDGPFGRTFAIADPDGYRIMIYEKDQPMFWPPRA